MKPTFDQVLRLIVCVAGIVFFGVGIWMVKTGISANGVIDIKSEVLSGHLETGSAGLFFAFFSFFMIVLPFVVGRHQARLQHTIGQPKRPKHKKTNRSISSAAILLSLVFSYSAMGQTNSPYALTSYLGFVHKQFPIVRRQINKMLSLVPHANRGEASFALK